MRQDIYKILASRGASCRQVEMLFGFGLLCAVPCSGAARVSIVVRGYRAVTAWPGIRGCLGDDVHDGALRAWTLHAKHAPPARARVLACSATAAQNWTSTPVAGHAYVA